MGVNTKVVDIKVKIGENQFKSLILNQYNAGTINFTLNKETTTSSATTGAWYNTSINGVPCYTPKVAISGITANTEGVLGISTSATPQIYDMGVNAKLRIVEQTNNLLTIAAFGPVPTENIPCHITNVYTPLA